MLETFKKNLTPYEAGLIQALGDAAIVTNEMAVNAAVLGRAEHLVYGKVYGYIVDTFLSACKEVIDAETHAELWDDMEQKSEELSRNLFEATVGYAEGASRNAACITWVGGLKHTIIDNKVLTDAAAILLDALGDRGNEEKAHLTGWAEAYVYATQKLSYLEEVEARE